MKILFTGASSFTGFWFAKTLAESGHQVFCTFTKSDAAAYVGIRGLRVKLLAGTTGIIPLWGQTVADLPARAASIAKWDVFCSHAAEVGDYKSRDFDVTTAVRRNTEGMEEVLCWLSRNGCKALLHSGTYFEADEGWGPGDKLAFSPYAISKGQTWEWVRSHGKEAGLAIGKFVMPNPFGPYEERGFTSYLAKSWLEGKIPMVNTPEYVRDNLPVSLMATCYKSAVEDMPATTSDEARFSPSGFVGKQGDFAKIFAARMEAEWKIPCPLHLGVQQEFSEPMARANSEKGIEDSSMLDSFWQSLASFYWSVSLHKKASA